MAREKDFFEEIYEESTRRNPEFPLLVREAEERLRLIRRLAKERRRRGLTQAEVARRMKTSQPAVARLEAGEVDPKISTVARYAGVLGRHLTWQLKESSPKKR